MPLSRQPVPPRPFRRPRPGECAVARARVHPCGHDADHPEEEGVKGMCISAMLLVIAAVLYLLGDDGRAGRLQSVEEEVRTRADLLTPGSPRQDDDVPSRHR